MDSDSLFKLYSDFQDTCLIAVVGVMQEASNNTMTMTIDKINQIDINNNTYCSLEKNNKYVEEFQKSNPIDINKDNTDDVNKVEKYHLDYYNRLIEYLNQFDDGFLKVWHDGLDNIISFKYLGETINNPYAKDLIKFLQ